MLSRRAILSIRIIVFCLQCKLSIEFETKHPKAIKTGEPYVCKRLTILFIWR